MSMPTSLGSLPNEILSSIVWHLSAHDLTQLAATCKHFSIITEPLLWADIEFHGAGYHESSSELNIPPPFFPPGQRRYLAQKTYGQRNAHSFFSLLRYYQTCNIRRLKQLAARVRSLCTAVSPFWRYYPYMDLEAEEALLCPQLWTLLPYFENLEMLELHGECGTKDPGILGPRTCNLRFLKLSGYIPRAVASWAIMSGSKLERLELGMLDDPIEYQLSPEPEEAQGDLSGTISDLGSLHGDAVIPRPLGGFLVGYDGVELSLPRLQHLYLCQPAEACEDTAVDYSWSSRAEEGCLKDWRQILIASGKTLKTLVLDQRVGADYLEGDTYETEEFMKYCASGPGSRALVNAVELLVKDAVLPALSHVYLYGIKVGDSTSGNPSRDLPGGHFMLLLQSLNIKCESRLGTWCYFDKFDGSTSGWVTWDPESEDEYESEEDEESDNDEVPMKWDSVLARV